jgi:hypothetical protein
MNKTRFPVFILLLLGALLLKWGTTRAQSERKQAKAFVQKMIGMPVVVSPPAFLYKYNLKTEILDSIPYFNQRQKDSILWVHSDYIRKINDSIFIARFMTGYRTELKKYGLLVVQRPFDSTYYRIHVAQIELEEQYYFYSDTAYYGNNIYVHHQNLNAVDVSSWFVLSGPLVPDKKGKVLFAENLLTDNLEGHFQVDPYSGEIKYLYTVDSLTVKKIYAYAKNLGRTYAGYTFDYLLNTFLTKNLPASKRTKRYWRYDPYRHKFFSAFDDRFVPLDNDQH